MTDRERVAANSQRWRELNPEKRREVVRKSNEKRAKAKREWRQQRDYGTVIEKKHCAMCGTAEGGPKGLVIHHKDGCNGNRGLQLNNDPDNLVVLCRSCHPKIHGRMGLKPVPV